MSIFGIPKSPLLTTRSRVYELKARLDWGEPALTIVDVRSRAEFAQSRISGAINLPPDQLVHQALRSLEPIRDIYVYGDTDEEGALAATKLREAGYQNVSEIQGGLPAWKAYGYPIESGFVFVA
ncbi:MAG: rhodanese-like domain-containing protein [Elainellaceae cyanobacterium]